MLSIRWLSGNPGRLLPHPMWWVVRAVSHSVWKRIGPHAFILTALTERFRPCVTARSPRVSAELCGLLAQIVTLTPAVKTLRGLSWLYHHHRYRRLFPPAYLRSAMPVTDRYRNMPLWGQFLRWDGSLRAERASHLYQHIQGEFHPSRLATGFPLQPLAVSAPVTVFQAFYARR